MIKKIMEMEPLKLILILCFSNIIITLLLGHYSILDRGNCVAIILLSFWLICCGLIHSC